MEVTLELAEMRPAIASPISNFTVIEVWSIDDYFLGGQNVTMGKERGPSDLVV